MSKKRNTTLSQDIVILNKILQHQYDILDVLNEGKCKSLKQISSSKLVTSSCALYISQIGELIDLLTDKSKSMFNSINCVDIYKVRNIIDHNYLSIRAEAIGLLAMSLSSNMSIKETKDVRTYCNKNKRSI